MYSLLSHNTFGIDVYAERFQEYASVEELKTLIAQGALTTPFFAYRRRKQPAFCQRL